jgi:hypothetical protein
VEVDGPVAEAVFVEQLEAYANVAGEGGLAASDDRGHEEQVVLVDEPGLDRPSRELGTADGEITGRSRFQLPDASGSKSRSIRVLALVTVGSVLE